MSLVSTSVYRPDVSKPRDPSALAKAGFKIAHIDHNQYYGGDEASLSLDELAEWAQLRSASSTDDQPGEYLIKQRARFTSISCSSSVPERPRQYAVSLAPTLIPSVGPHIDSLIASGVSRYGGFKLLEKVAVYDRPGYVQKVPGSKEDVFKSKVLSLVDKRRLMRFLLFAAGDFEGKQELQGKENVSFVQFLRETFSLDNRTASAIAYALAFCPSAQGELCISVSSTDDTPFMRIDRRYVTCSPEDQTVSPVYWAIWRITIPCRSLWGLGRDCPRVLSHFRRAWEHLHPWPTHRFAGTTSCTRAHVQRREIHHQTR